MPSHKERTDLVTIAIADSTRIHTQLLAEALHNDAGLQVVASASNSADLLAAVTRVPIDVLIINHSLDDQPARGPEVLREIRALRPHIKGVILLESSKPEQILDCFRAGAKGVFCKHERLESLGKCIRTVHEGQIWARSAELDLALEALAKSPLVRAANHQGLELLSTRERQVVEYLASGRTNREIAESLGLSHHTIKNYLFRIFDKLGVSSRTELLYLTMSRLQFEPVGNGAKAEDEVPSLIEAAQAGLPSAQLRLAKLCTQTNHKHSDPVSAYMWYLIADKTTAAMRQQIAEGTKNLIRTISASQRVQAEQRAEEWFRTARKHSAFAPCDDDLEKLLADTT